jgi:FkbM family methyltransferase
MKAALPLRDRIRFLYRAWRYRCRVEPAEIRFLLQSVKPGQTCLDIGGHKGAFTYWLQRRVGPTGKVYAFEPQPELFAYLERATQSLGLHNVKVVYAAVSSSSGKCQLFRPTDAPSPGATVEPGIHAGWSLMVPKVALDQYLGGFQGNRISFVKCDVEGHELDVFRGAESILREHRPTLLFECEQRHNRRRPIAQVFDYLMSLGYDGHFFQQRRLRSLSDFPAAQSDYGQAGYAYNFLFLPRDRGALGRRVA